MTVSPRTVPTRKSGDQRVVEKGKRRKVAKRAKSARKRNRK